LGIDGIEDRRINNKRNSVDWKIKNKIELKRSASVTSISGFVASITKRILEFSLSRVTFATELYKRIKAVKTTIHCYESWKLFDLRVLKAALMFGELVYWSAPLNNS
jgi:hypothetical protein